MPKGRRTGARRSSEPELMGVTEAAEALGRRPTNMYGKNTPPGMPEPYQKLKCGSLWRAADIYALAEERTTKETTTA